MSDWLGWVVGVAWRGALRGQSKFFGQGGATVAEDEGVLGSWFLWLDNCPELFHISDLQFCQP